ncbi:anibiotic ABC transporter [Enterobacter sp. SGAir0187]|uniref:TolC family outer membrane protein n=1 Tax=Enterobacter sp. SGAir0187 TaxID=2836161 RepID=UPI000CEB654A|nr:TolC family outer membrane protein [Enterobacter sp. SGAir0187]AVH17536.1 anibiotic ABC transporter [Enterobacter sp. SGAir0187]
MYTCTAFYKNKDMRIIFISFIMLANAFFVAKSYSLNIEESVLAANIFDPEMNAARNEHDADSEKRRQGFSGLLPSVSFNGAWTKTDQPNASYAAGVTRHNATINLTQPIFDLSKYADWKKGDAIAELADAKLLQAQQRLIRNTIIAWSDVVYRREMLSNKNHVLKLYQQKLKQIQSQMVLGESTLLDVSDAQARFDKAQADIVNAQSELSDAELVFSNLTGRDANEINEMTLTCIPSLEASSHQQMLDHLMRDNLDIRSAQLFIKQSDADVLGATSGHLPVVSLQAGYGTNWSRAEDSNELDVLFGTTNKTRDTVLSLNVSIPLFSGGRALSQSFEAAKRRAQSKDLLALAQLRAKQSLSRSLNALKSGFTHLAATERALHSAHQRLDSTRYGRELGMRTLIDELDSLNEYATALSEKSEVQFSLIKAHTDLDATLGELDMFALKKYSCVQ